MATKIFIFCNKHSSVFIKSLVSKAWTRYSVADGRRSSDYKDTEQICESLEKDRYCDMTIVDNYQKYIGLDFAEIIKINPQSHQAADKIFFFIIPELFWKTGNIDEGYEYALDIITNKLNKGNNILQLRFLSILPYKTLVDRSRPSLKRLVESFPYFDLLVDQARICESSFIEYTSTHYQLIKKLAISDAGYINYLLHEIGNTITSPNPSVQNDNNLLNSITGLKYLNNDIQDLCASYTFESRVDVFNNFKRILNDLLLNYYTDPTTRSFSKFQHKVMIVEDDRIYRQFLKTELQKFFVTVDTIEQEQNEEFSDSLKENLFNVTEKYDIVFLDLMFKNENGNWADYSGLDLYKTIKARNHYCVTPIITSLPRAVVASLIQEVDEKGIPYHLLLSKANGKDFFLLDLKDKLSDIVKTCRDNQKRRTMFQPIPKEGIFKLAPGIMQVLINERIKEYETIVANSFRFFNLYKQSKLNVNTSDWDSGKLPAPHMLKPEKLNESYLSQKLTSILTHRLIVIDYALNFSSDNIVIKSRYESYVMKDICNQSLFDKAYLTSKLGFSVSVSKQETPGYIIAFQDLFTHEYDYILKQELKKNSSENSVNLKEWFIDLFCNMEIYENWEALELDFYPYINTSDIDNNGFIKSGNLISELSIDHIIKFLNAVQVDKIDSYVIKIYEVVDRFLVDKRNDTTIPKTIHRLIDEIWFSN